MPSRIPTSRSRHLHKKRFCALRLDRYNPSRLQKKELRLIISIRHAQRSEREIIRKIEQYYGRQPHSKRQELSIIINGEEYTISSTERLTEAASLHEYVWYVPVNHQLTDLFALDFKIVVMPQHHIRFKEFDWNKRQDFVDYCIPDFCVSKFRIRRAPGVLEVLDGRILLIVECKRSAHNDADLAMLKREAWTQVLEQAGYLFSRQKDQDYVGVMITIGVSWAFRVITRSDACFPAAAQHAFRPPDSSSSESDGPYQTLRDIRRTRLQHKQCLPDVPSLFLEFGTVESDNRLQIVRKQLLKIA